jgi:stearoyl-CoA desaturase (Delta-9 desaturase)
MKIEKFNTVPALFLIIYQTVFLVSLPIYLLSYSPSTSLLLISFLLFWVTGISITGGYHRLYSHRTYQAAPVLEFFILLFGTMATQGSALRWSCDHRIHHAFVDTDNDPYTIKKGFWYAHFLWIMEKPKPIDPKVVPDLMKNKLVMLQHRFYPIWMVLTNFLAWAAVGWALNDYLGALVIAVAARMFFLHHCTWFINSLAHTWGDKPFCQEQTAVDNYFLSFLTFGEGYHNYHHSFANDYRNGIRWYHFDPTKWSIWIFSKLGLTRSLKRTHQSVIQKKMVMQRKDLLIEHIRTVWVSKREELEQKVQELSDQLLGKLTEMRNLRDSISNTELKQLKHAIHQDWLMWQQLTRDIMKQKHPMH